MYNGKFRHIRGRHNTIRQLLSSGVINMDLLIEGLNRELVDKSSRGMRLNPIRELSM